MISLYFSNGTKVEVDVPKGVKLVRVQVGADTQIRVIEELGLSSDALQIRLDLPVSHASLNFSVRTLNCLQLGVHTRAPGNPRGWEHRRIDYLGQLVQLSEAELMRTKSFGRMSLNNVKSALDELGLRLQMRTPELLGWTVPPRKEASNAPMA